MDLCAAAVPEPGEVPVPSPSSLSHPGRAGSGRRARPSCLRGCGGQGG